MYSTDSSIRSTTVTFCTIPPQSAALHTTHLQQNTRNYSGFAAHCWFWRARKRPCDSVNSQSAFGCMIAIRGGYRMARGWYCTKLSLSSALLLCFSSVCFLLLFLSFCRFCFAFVFCFVFMFSLELCSCSSDIFLSSRPRGPDWQPRLPAGMFYWIWLRPDRSKRRTQPQQQQSKRWRSSS